jgi:hypothetical protein
MRRGVVYLSGDMGSEDWPVVEASVVPYD